MIELFRKEVFERRGNRLLGEINLALPMGWQIVGYLLAAAVVAAALFLSAASYTRLQVVEGVIIPDAGVVAVVPTRSGVLVNLYVREGSSVVRGQPLAKVRVSETLGSGAGSADQLSAAITNQEESLLGQSDALMRVTEQEALRRAEQVRGAERELAEMDAQIGIQKELVRAAQENLDRTNEAAKSGFISRRDILAREEALMVRRQQLSQLEQGKAAKEAVISEGRRGLAQLAAQGRADREAARVRLGELGRQRVEAATAEGYTLVAPVDGIATAVAAQVGQAVDSSSALVAILPRGSSLRAELAVPARAIGFVRAGQEVRLAVDGFAVEQFGALKARVLTVPSAPVTSRDEEGNLVSAYRVICEIASSEIAASGDRYRLVAGMTLSAQVATRKRSLLNWILEPFQAVSRR